MSTPTTLLLTIAALAVAAGLSLHRYAVTAQPRDDTARYATALGRFGVAVAVLAAALQAGTSGMLTASMVAVLWGAAKLIGVTTYRPQTEAPPFPPEWIEEFAEFQRTRHAEHHWAGAG